MRVVPFRRSKFTIVAACAWLLMLGSLARAGSPGDLDTTFDDDGRQRTDLGDMDHGKDLLVRPGGKLILIGPTRTGALSNWAIAQYRAGGALDDGWGGDGVVKTDFNGAEDDAVSGVLLENGKLLVVGSSEAPNEDIRFGIARYRENGTRDTSFGGGDGEVVTNFRHLAFAYGVLLLPDDSFIVVGEQYLDREPEPDIDNFALARYQADGRLMRSFGTDGRVITDFAGGGDGAWRVVRIGDRILVGGWGMDGPEPNDYEVALARYHFDGRRDMSFSGDGRKLISVVDDGNDYVYDLLKLQSGKLIVLAHAVRTTIDIGLVRLTEGLGLDESFGGDGIVTRNFGGEEFGKGIAKLDGKLVVGGTTDAGMTAFRFLAGGAKDSGFGSGGMAPANFNTTATNGTDVVIHEGKIVVGGDAYNGNDYDFALARFLP